MGEEVPEWQMMWGAKVKTPIDMPDDILKDAITTVIQELSSSSSSNSSNSAMSYESEEKEEKEKEGRANTKDTSTKNRRASLLSPNINNNEHQQVVDNTNTTNNNNNMGTVTDEMVKKIKNHMDSKWSPTWHVVIGRNFGSLVTHETKSFIYFYYENQAVMMFKAG